MSNATDNLKAYSEACNTLRHYSNASLTVRLASVVQGIAILGAWAYALTQKISPLIIVFPIAGLIFTALLYRFHLGYLRATWFFYDAAAKIEERFFDEDCRPISAYNNKYEEMYATFWAKFFTLNAPFALIGTLFLLALVTAFWVLILNKG
ncbi:MAG: hypothetical protein WBV94_14410 [Blastocatellia bacterium]